MEKLAHSNLELHKVGHADILRQVRRPRPTDLIGRPITDSADLEPAPPPFSTLRFATAGRGEFGYVASIPWSSRR